MIDNEQRVVKFERLEWQKIGYFNGWSGFDTNPTIDQVPGKYKKVEYNTDQFFFDKTDGC